MHYIIAAVWGALLALVAIADMSAITKLILIIGITLASYSAMLRIDDKANRRS